MGKNKNKKKGIYTDCNAYVVGRISLVKESISIELDSVNSPTGRAILRKFVRGLRRRKPAKKVVWKNRTATHCGTSTGRRS